MKSYLDDWINELDIMAEFMLKNMEGRDERTINSKLEDLLYDLRGTCITFLYYRKTPHGEPITNGMVLKEIEEIFIKMTPLLSEYKTKSY